LAEAGPFMDFQAGNIFGKDAGLKGPKAVFFTFFDQRLQQLFAEALATAFSIDIDADFGDAGIDAAAGDGGKSGPCEDLVVLDSYEAAVFEMGCVPFFPGWGSGLEGSVAGGQAAFVDGFYGGPVFGQEGEDLHGDIL